MRLFGSFVVVVGLVPLMGVFGCKQPVPENNTCDGDWFSQFLADEPAPEADLSCAAGALTDEDPFDASCAVAATLDARTVDHQSKDPVGGMSVDFFAGDDLTAAPDWSATSDADGNLSHDDVPLCAPIAYVNDRNDNDSRVTVGQHVVLEPGDAGAAPTFDFRNVANGTLSLVTLILGVDLKDENGFLFGKVAGCDGDVAVDKVQILVHDDNCSVPKAFSSGYTDNELPSAFVRSTTADGFFFGVNVPPGDWTVDGYVKDGDSFRLIASAPISVKAGQVTLADLQIGRSDGLRTFTRCTGSCG